MHTNTLSDSLLQIQIYTCVQPNTESLLCKNITVWARPKPSWLILTWEAAKWCKLIPSCWNYNFSVRVSKVLGEFFTRLQHLSLTPPPPPPPESSVENQTNRLKSRWSVSVRSITASAILIPAACQALHQSGFIIVVSVVILNVAAKKHFTFTIKVTDHSRLFSAMVWFSNLNSLFCSKLNYQWISEELLLTFKSLWTFVCKCKWLVIKFDGRWNKWFSFKQAAAKYSPVSLGIIFIL